MLAGSHDLVHEVLDGAVDVAIVNEPSESAMLTQVKVEETPYYVALSKSDPLAAQRQFTFRSLDRRHLILFERRLHPVLCDCILERLELSGAKVASVAHITAPEEAFPFVSDGRCLALVVKAGALLLARSGVTVRPFVEDDFRLKTYLISRSDNDSRIISELVRSFMKKLAQIEEPRPQTLSLFPN